MTHRCPMCLDTGAVTTPDMFLDACPLCCERAAAEWEAVHGGSAPRPRPVPPAISNVVNFTRKAG